MEIRLPKFIGLGLFSIAVILSLVLLLMPGSIGSLQTSLSGRTATLSPSERPSPVVYDTPAPVLVQFSTLDAEACQATEAAIETYVLAYQFSTEEIMTITADAAKGVYWSFDTPIEESHQQATFLPKITPEAGGVNSYNNTVLFTRSIDNLMQIQSTYGTWEYWETDEGKALQNSLDEVNKFLYWGYRRFNLFAAANAEYPLSIFPALENFEGNYSIDDPLIGPGIAGEDYPEVYPYADEIEKLIESEFSSCDIETAPEDFREGMNAFTYNFGEIKNISIKAMEWDNTFSEEEFDSFLETYSLINDFINHVFKE